MIFSKFKKKEVKLVLQSARFILNFLSWCLPFLQERSVNDETDVQLMTAHTESLLDTLRDIAQVSCNPPARPAASPRVLHVCVRLSDGFTGRRVLLRGRSGKFCRPSAGVIPRLAATQVHLPVPVLVPAPPPRLGSVRPALHSHKQNPPAAGDALTIPEIPTLRLEERQTSVSDCVSRTFEVA